MKKKVVYILILFFSIQNYAQNIPGLPFISNFSSKDYHAHFQNFDIQQNNEGIIIAANVDGLLSYTEKNWTLIPSPNITRALTITQQNRIFIAGENMFGEIKKDFSGKIKFVSRINWLPKKYQNLNSIDYINSLDTLIYILNDSVLIVVNENFSKVIHFNTHLYYLFKANNKLYISGYDKYYTVKGTTVKVHTLSGNDLPFNFFLSNDSLFLSSFKQYIYYINDNDSAVFVTKFNISDTISISFYNKIQNQYIISTYTNGIFFISPKGKIILNLNKDKGLPSEVCFNSFIDKSQNVWLLTDNGISYIETNLPIKVLDERYNINITTPLSAFANDTTIYVNTGYFLYKINKENLKIHKINRIVGQIWDIKKIGNDLYFLYNSGIIRLNKKEKIQTFGPPINHYKILKIPNSKQYYIAATAKGLFIYKYNGDSLVFVKKIKGFDNSARTIFIDSLNYLWVNTQEHGIYRLKLDTAFNITEKKFYSSDKGLNDFSSIMFFYWQKKFFISTYKTLYIYDYQNDTIHVFHPITDNYNTNNGNVLQLIHISPEGLLWFEYYDKNYNSKVFILKESNGKYKEIYPQIRRLGNKYISLILDLPQYKLIVSQKGLFFVNLAQLKNYPPNNFKTFITKITTNNPDTTIFTNFLFEPQNAEFKLKYDYHNVTFHFFSTFYSKNTPVQYRYQLVNYDKKWSQWTEATTKEYTNLPPGTYTFKIQAKNIYNVYSNINYLTLIITPPWYRTTLAYIFYTILTVLIFWFVAKLFNRHLIRKNEKLEKIIEERTKIIKLKNAELEQQKEEILTQAEELVIVNQELEKLSTIVRESDNAIILMDPEGNFIWINSAFTKMFGYTFEELVNEISPNIIGDTTLPEIKEIINKCLTEKKTVEYILKVKNKFNKEIWVHTTLTPILGEDGEITSLVAIDSDITNIKLAEKKIRQQRDHIKSSITYARTIQESIMPSEEKINKFFHSFIIFKPKDIVSGDFYWISNLFEKGKDRLRKVHISQKFGKGNIIYTAVVDCTGHGVPGAFMSLIGDHLLRTIINEERIESPKAILEKMDNELTEILNRSKAKNHDGMVMSLCKFEKTDNNKAIVTFAGAKQKIAVYFSNKNDIIKFKSTPRHIGYVVNDKIKFQETLFEITDKDIIYLYTDGLLDLNNKQRQNYGFSRLKKLLLNNIDKDFQEVKKLLTQEINNWLDGVEQRDDITFWALKIK